MFEKLVQGKMEKETAKMEVALLKQRVVHQQLPTTFDSLRISMPISLQTLEDEHLRQNLIDQYEKLIQRTKSEMMIFYVKAEEAQMNEKNKKFDTDLAQMKHDRSHGSPDKKLTDTMLEILKRRFQNINERLIKIYKLKLHFFVKAPIVNKT